MIRRELPLVLLAALLAGLSAGCGSSEAAIEPGEPAPSTLAVSRGDWSSQMLLTGELRAEDAVHFIAPNANIWPLQVRWVAPDGVDVAAGDVVVEFDTTQLVSNLEEQMIQVLEAMSELDSEKARIASEIAEAELDLERKKAELEKARLDAEVPRKLRSDREYELSQLALQRAELELEGAQRKLENARSSGASDIELKQIDLEKAAAEVRRAEASIRELALTAPRDGLLVINENFMEERPVRPGDQVHPGMPVAQLPELATLGVEARLFDVDDETVKPGQKVRAWLDAFPDRELTGRVREIDDIANQDGGRSLRRFFTVYVTLDEVDPAIMRPGMSVKLVIESEPRRGVLLVPRAAVDWSTGEARAATVDGRLADLELGPCNSFRCVLEAGLEAGDELRPAWEVAP